MKEKPFLMTWSAGLLAKEASLGSLERRSQFGILHLPPTNNNPLIL